MSPGLIIMIITGAQVSRLIVEKVIIYLNLELQAQENYKRLISINQDVTIQWMSLFKATQEWFLPIVLLSIFSFNILNCPPKMNSNMFQFKSLSCFNLEF